MATVPGKSKKEVILSHWVVFQQDYGETTECISTKVASGTVRLEQRDRSSKISLF